MPSGTADQLWRYPVKSMAGERVDDLRVDWRGAGGDRTHAVWHERKGRPQPLTARQAPGLLRWAATYDGADVDPHAPPLATVIAPDGERLRWDDPGLAGRLSAGLGTEPLELRRDIEGQQDLGRTLLVTTGASLRALSAELGTAVDLRRFRTNLHLETDAPPWAELGWEGRTAELGGGVTLELLHPCMRCVIPTRQPGTGERWAGLLRHLAARHATSFGVNARVTAGGRVAVGDRLTIR